MYPTNFTVVDVVCVRAICRVHAHLILSFGMWVPVLIETWNRMRLCRIRSKLSQCKLGPGGYCLPVVPHKAVAEVSK